MKKSRGFKIVIAIVAVILIAAGAGFIFLKSKLAKINRINPEDETCVSRDQETFEADVVSRVASNGDAEETTMQDTMNPEDVVWDNVDMNVMKDKDVKNILLIGQDRRPGQGRQRSDSLIICSINKKTGKITLCSLMRDMYVPIPGYSDNRINAAYVFGGMPLIDQLIEEDFGIHIDGNIEVDFDGFIEALGVVGPLDIELKDYEVDYMNNASSSYGAESWNLTEGMNSLTPEQALVYARTRYVGNSDWERTDRQRTVITTVFNKIKDKDLFELMDIADEILPCLTTDMTDSELLGYVYTIATSKMEMGDSCRIPAEGTYSNQTIRGMMVLVPNLTANSKELKKDIYGE